MYPSGEQHALRYGDHRAVVVEVGGALRTYDVGDIEVLDGFPAEQMCDGCRGTSLLPWPNRVAGGRYHWDGVDYQLILTEPGRGNASHGLARWACYRLVERSDSRLLLGYTIHAQSGWPFLLDLLLDYELTDAGLSVTITMTNVGTQAAPVAAGAHPYLSTGGALVDDCSLTVPASTLVPADANGVTGPPSSAVGTPFDFQEPCRVGDLVIDQAYTNVLRNTAGEAVVRLDRPDGLAVEMWAGAGYDYLQLFTGDTLAPSRRRRGMAAEPMTAPSNALQSGNSLARLEPDESLTLRWGLRVGS